MKTKVMALILPTLLACCGAAAVPTITTVSPTRTVNGFSSVAERRIWVLVDGIGVYRCADAGAEGSPPRAACVLAPLSSGRE